MAFSLFFIILNEDKTEIIVFSPSECSKSINLDLGEMSVYLKPWVKNLGFIFDSDLKFDRQINSVVKTCFYQLRLLEKVKPFVSFKDLEKLIHVFISSRLDYCNSLYLGINQHTLARLQYVQNATARFLCGIKKREHITPILRSLLPVRVRVEFKVLLLVYKSLNSLAPTYLSEMITEYKPARAL